MKKLRIFFVFNMMLFFSLLTIGAMSYYESTSNVFGVVSIGILGMNLVVFTLLNA